MNITPIANNSFTSTMHVQGALSTVKSKRFDDIQEEVETGSPSKIPYSTQVSPKESKVVGLTQSKALNKNPTEKKLKEDDDENEEGKDQPVSVSP